MSRPYTKRGLALQWCHAAAAAETDDCLLFPFPARNGSGYGRVQINGQRKLAHQVVLELAGRELPTPPLETRHLCGRRLCCNKRHLVSGTRLENTADRKVHGTEVTGTRNGMAVLTPKKVVQIRAAAAAGTTQTALAEKHHVSRKTIYQVVSRRGWSHVP